jgi:polyhydroxybutyrate depolymerase
MPWLFVLLLALAPVVGQAVDTRRLTLPHDGVDRAYILDAAPDLRDAPLLIVLHGGIGGAEFMRRRADVSLAWKGWAVAWPSAVDQWNDGRRDARGRPYGSGDDLGFLRALVARLSAEGLVDPDRVFVAGPSIGGVMALRLLCEAPDLIAGAAVAIAALPQGYDCPAGPPRPVLFLHGDADPLMPPEGGPVGGRSPFVRDRGAVIAAETTAAQLARRNGCDGFETVALPDRAPDDGSTVVRRDHRGCAAPFVHYVVQGGGHAWPGARASRMGDAIIGATNRDIAATAEVERFFLNLLAD